MLPTACIIAASPALAAPETLAVTLDTVTTRVYLDIGYVVTSRHSWHHHPLQLVPRSCSPRPHAGRQVNTMHETPATRPPGPWWVLQIFRHISSNSTLFAGLYGNAAPDTVRNFLAMAQSGALSGTTFHKVFPGELIKAGQQGSKRNGQVEPPEVYDYRHSYA